MTPGAELRHVLMTADAVGGVWTYALDLARGLRQHGVRTTLVTMGPPPRPDQVDEAAGVAGLSLLTGAYRLEWMDDPWEDVERAGRWLLGLEHEQSPDIVHVNGYVHGSLPWQAPVVVAGHSCVLSWWEAVRREPAPPEWDTYRVAVAAGLASAGVVVAPTAAMLQALGRHYGRLPRCLVVPNGRSLPAVARREVREPIILAAGRLWDEAKNLAALDRVAPRLPWPVLVAGDADAPDGGRAAARHVRLLGRLPARELAAWLELAAIYALPARYEPFGLSALEAALCGCALVLGDIPTLREVWGDAAVFVPPDDSEALASALTALAGDEPRRRDLAEAALARARGFTIERMTEGTLSAYRVAAERRREEQGEVRPRSVAEPSERVECR